MNNLGTVKTQDEILFELTWILLLTKFDDQLLTVSVFVSMIMFSAVCERWLYFRL